MNKGKPIAQKALQWIVIGGLFCGLYVILGAFGAHGLESHLSPKDQQTYHTGLRYMVIHGIGLMLINLIYLHLERFNCWVNWLMLSGIVLFSISLLIYATRTLTGLDLNVFARVAPVGGLSFVAGWFLFSLGLLKR